MRVTESNVVQQIKNKNEKAISFLISEYGGLLTSIINRHIYYEKMDREECLDDVLLAIWYNIDSFDPEKNAFKQWIAAIAKYKAIDYQRRLLAIHNKQFPTAEFDEAIIGSMHSTATVSSVDDLLQHLPQSERIIFEKYYLEGTPTEEIAEKFSAKTSWIYNKLSRGRKRLRSIIANKES